MDRKELAKQIVMLTAASNPNMPPHARRIAGVRFRQEFSELEIETAAADLGAEAMREIARILGGGANV